MKTGILLSGGMDSIALAYWKKPEVAFTVNYGQLPARGEERAARQVCEVLGIVHHLIHVDCSSLGSGDMAGKDTSEFAPASDWWPYRNQLLLTLAAMKAISVDVGILLIGTVRTDGIHADGTKTFIDAIGHLLSVQEARLRIVAPAIELSSADLIRQSGAPIDLLSWAHSCHTADYACGDCRGCNKHREVMHELGHEVY